MSRHSPEKSGMWREGATLTPDLRSGSTPDQLRSLGRVTEPF